MAHIKNLVITCFFSMFLVMSKEALALSKGNLSSTSSSEQCSAPAPDSLKIITIGGDFVELGWIPAWEGARQKVEVLVKSSQSDWTPQFALDSVVGSSIILGGLDLTQEYGVKISTFCPSGELSTQSKFIDGINLIIDLAVAGKNPVNPTNIDCKDIPLSNKWIGFRIGYISNGIQLSNVFEFFPDHDNNQENSISHVIIKRVMSNHPIIVSKEAAPHPFPTNFMPIIENVGNSIRMDRLINNGIERFLIGMVNISLTSTTVSLCPDPNFPLPPNHSFNAMISNLDDYVPGEEVQNKSIVAKLNDNKFSYINPINDIATFKFDGLENEDKILDVMVFTQQGRLVAEKQTSFSNGLFEVNLQGINSGCLIFMFKINNLQYAIPVFKI